MSDTYHEEATEGQFEDEVHERHSSGGMFSSEEVSSMTSAQFTEVMRDAGRKQKGRPERFALVGQDRQGTKLGNEDWINEGYGSALENVGDVYNRMTSAPSFPADENAVWSPSGKTAQAVAHLQPLADGFKVIESWTGGYHKRREAVNWIPTDEEREWGKGYSEAHAQLPVYTPVQHLANRSAIHLGYHQFGQAMENLGTMRQMEIDHGKANPDRRRGGPVNPDTNYNRLMSQPASVEFLRSQGR